MKIKMTKRNISSIIYTMLFFCMFLFALVGFIKINKLKFENAAMSKATTGFVTMMHEKAEDLFYPCVPWDWGSLSGIKIQSPESKDLTKIKYTDIKLKSRSEQENLEFQNIFKDPGFTYGLKIQNYNEALSSFLTPQMQQKLEKTHYITEYNNELFTFDGGKGCMNFFLYSDFIPKNISKDKLEYVVKSKYTTDAENEKKYRQEGKIDQQYIKTITKDFILIKQNDRWLIDQFETSRYAFPD